MAHRDYTSNASIQVMLFADRLEIWNPGELPPQLTVDNLRRPHASIPRSPRIAEPLFLARELGYYNDARLRLVELPSSTANLMALASGEVEAATLTLDELLIAREGQLDTAVGEANRPGRAPAIHEVHDSL